MKGKLISSNREYRGDIQILRGIAVLAVVFFHAKKDWFPHGYLGVDVFFVVSGFVVTPLVLQIFEKSFTLTKKLNGIKHFYINRFYRLAPALIVTLISTSILILFFGPTNEHQKFTHQGIATLLLVGNVAAYHYVNDYFSPDINPLIHTWSLSVEEQIYILFPILFLILLRKSRQVGIVFLSTLSIISLISFIVFISPELLDPIYTLFRIESATQFSFYSPINRVWQFSMGGLLFLFNKKNVFQRMKNSFLIALLSVFALFLLLLSNLIISLKVDSVVITIVSIFVIASYGLQLLPEGISKILQWFGDRSYSIYLLHMPLIYLKTSPFFKIHGIDHLRIQLVVAVFLTIVLGHLMYSKIESRFRQTRVLIQARNNNFSSKFISLSMIFCLVLLVTINFMSRNQYFGLQIDKVPPLYAGFSDPDCQRDSTNGPPCLYPIIDATKTVLLIGDSHAGDISQAVIDGAHKQNWNAVIWTQGGSVIQFEKSLRRQSELTLERAIKIKNWIMTNKPDAIIVSQSIHLNDNFDLLKSGLLELSRYSSNILLLENRPIFSDKSFMKPRPLLSQILRIGSEESDYPKSVPISKMDFSDKEIEDMFAKFALSIGVSTLNLWSMYCDSLECTRFANGSWLYFDADHFSIKGAQRLIPLIQEYLITIEK